MYFHSDNKLSYSGFQISYKVVSGKVRECVKVIYNSFVSLYLGIPSCGGTFTTETGQITSPIVEFSTLELQYLDCEYKISVANQLRIKITFLKMKLYKLGMYCTEHVSVSFLSGLIGIFIPSTICV